MASPSEPNHGSRIVLLVAADRPHHVDVSSSSSRQTAREHTLFTFIYPAKAQQKIPEVRLACFFLSREGTPVCSFVFLEGEKPRGTPRLCFPRESAEAEAEGVRRPRPQGRGAIGPEGTGPEKALLPRPPPGPFLRPRHLSFYSPEEVHWAAA